MLHRHQFHQLESCGERGVKIEIRSFIVKVKLWKGRCYMRVGVISDIHNNVVAKVYPSEINLYEGTISLLIYSVHR